ncbi:GNAT family N-acetyltransferase [Nocardia sp. NPDC050175]|uniref:GNAT family N-acetyltransferase n=1 Tax=Nocardia sp. NPDC050175 TaxID=3364317 RepID=UPI0037AA102B
MLIEPLRQQLIPEVIALMGLGAPDITARSYSDYWLYATLFSSTCPVAVIDNRLAGAISAFRSQDDPADLYIQDVMVDPNYRRRGITRAMIDHLRAHAEDLGCRRMYLTSTPGNTTAHRTWEALGFHNVRGDATVHGTSVITDYKGPGKTRAVFERLLET